MLERMARLVRPQRPGETDRPAAETAVDAGSVSEERLIAALRTVFDPEIPVNIYDLGLIYAACIGSDGDIKIEMTLTAPGCPVAGSLPRAVEDAVRRVPGVRAAQVELVWDPPWSPERMSDEARLELGML